MLLKCPHCNQVKNYSDSEFRRIFIQCKGCGREFRAAECSPLTGKQDRNRTEILEMSAEASSQGGPGAAPGVKYPTTDTGRERKGLLNRLFGR